MTDELATEAISQLKELRRTEADLHGAADCIRHGNSSEDRCPAAFCIKCVCKGWAVLLALSIAAKPPGVCQVFCRDPFTVVM